MIPAKSDREGASSAYELPPDLIRIWRVFLDRGPVNNLKLQELLSPDELDRARRFHFERDQRRFTLAKRALRMILGGYLKSDPKTIVFHYGPQGKPRLANETSGIQFNVSHSEELAVIAVARERELGVDVEHLRSSEWAEENPEGFFSAREVAMFRSLPRDQAQAAFFTCWTRKEAYIKARGCGLSIPLEDFDVSLEPEKPAALLHVKNDPDEPNRWGMAELRPAPGYIGAIVAMGKDWRFAFSDWTGPT